MANGLVVADTGISVGGRAVLGANLGRVQVGMITHTSDTALATKAAGGSQMGSHVSMTIPAAGIIRVTIIEGEFDETESSGTGKASIGLKVGTDSIRWPVWDGYTGASVDFSSVAVGSGVTSLIITNGIVDYNSGPAAIPGAICWDIVGLSISTGAQEVEVWMGDNVVGSTSELTITGTTKTARFLVEVVDGS
jgi:hypothetical protein